MYGDNLTEAEVAALLDSNPWNQPYNARNVMRDVVQANHWGIVESVPLSMFKTYELYVSIADEADRVEIIWENDGHNATTVNLYSSTFGRLQLSGPTSLIDARRFIEGK